MSAEAERGCGYRQPGGLYLVTGSGGVGCDRLPVPIEPCRCCGFVPEQLRSHAWVPGRFLGDHTILGPYARAVRERDGSAVRGVDGRDQRGPPSYAKVPEPCRDHDASSRWGLAGTDPVCVPSEEPRLLMWVGRRFYTPDAFTAEADQLGISKRISQLPEGLVLGETWVLLAHPDACYEPVSWSFRWLFGDGEVLAAPGVFQAFIPQRVELILHEAQATPERIEREAKRGVSVVIIPDGARDARISWRPGEPRPELPVAPKQATLDEEHVLEERPGDAPEASDGGDA